MQPVYVSSVNVFSPLGATAGECFDHVIAMHSGVRMHESNEKFSEPFPAAIINDTLFDQTYSSFSRYEQLLLNSVTDALAKTSVDAASPETLFIFPLQREILLNLMVGQPLKNCCYSPPLKK